MSPVTRDTIAETLRGVLVEDSQRRLLFGFGTATLDSLADAVWALLTDAPTIKVEDDGYIMGSNIEHTPHKEDWSPIVGSWCNDSTADAYTNVLAEGIYALLRLEEP